jgi:Ca-activated chloride channel family protein
VGYRYTRYTGEDLAGVDLEELVSKLSDLLLSSGFDNPYGNPFDGDKTIQALHDAILDALLTGGMLSNDTLSQLLGDPADADQDAERSQLGDLIQQIIEQMAQQGYISVPPERGSLESDGVGDGLGGHAPPARFEVTDKSLDFLGYRALRDLLGSVGKGSVGRHDTRDLATGVDASGSSTPSGAPVSPQARVAASTCSTRTSWWRRANTRAPAPRS